MPTIIDPVTDNRYVCFLINKYNPASLDFDSTQDLHDFVYTGPYPKPIIVVDDEGLSHGLLVTAKVKPASLEQPVSVVYISAVGVSSLDMVEIVQKIRDGDFYPSKAFHPLKKMRKVLNKEKKFLSDRKKVLEEIDKDFKKTEEAYNAKKEKSSI